MDNWENCAIGKMWQERSKKDQKKNSQNRDFVFTSTLQYQNSLVLEDQNIGFWQWMKLHI